MSIGNTYLTLADMYKQQEGGEITASIIELLSQTNELLQDANVIECNDGTGHKTTVRNGLPSATFRKLYQGVMPSKSTTSQVRDTTSMLEAYSEVDSALVELSGNQAQFRLNEARAFMEAMNQECLENIFYGDLKSDTAKFDGLAVRYASIDSDKTKIGYNVIDAGGTGSDNTSIWFVTWGDLHCSMLYPKGTKAGLQHDDKGQNTKTLSDGSLLEVHRDHWKWNLGLSVRDWRSTCRIANIDVSEALAGNVDLLKYLRKAYFRVKKYSKTGRLAMYANSDMCEVIDALATDKSNVRLSIKEYDGKDITHYRNTPIRECEQLLNTESTVAAA